MANAREENVPVIDLWAMSKKLYAAMGEQVGEAFADPTHHHNYGAYELAKCVVQGNQAATIYVDAADWAGVIRAAKDLQSNIARVTERTAMILSITSVSRDPRRQSGD